MIWIDIDRPRVYRFDPRSRGVVERVVPSIGALTIEADGRLVFFERDGLVRVDGGSDSLTVSGVAGTRFNDAVCDAAGRVYCGGMPVAGIPGRLWRLEAGREPVAIADPVLPNGASVSPDGQTFYFTDTLRRCIYASPFDVGEGRIGPPRPFARVPSNEGLPDGLAVDTEGGVWSARYDGAMIIRYDPSGAESVRVPFPTSRPTGIAFGGDELSDLYVATAQVDGEPESGSLFRLATGHTGVAVPSSRLFG